MERGRERCAGQGDGNEETGKRTDATEAESRSLSRSLRRSEVAHAQWLIGRCGEVSAATAGDGCSAASSWNDDMARQRAAKESDAGETDGLAENGRAKRVGESADMREKVQRLFYGGREKEGQRRERGRERKKWRRKKAKSSVAPLALHAALLRAEGICRLQSKAGRLGERERECAGESVRGGGEGKGEEGGEEGQRLTGRRDCDSRTEAQMRWLQCRRRPRLCVSVCACVCLCVLCVLRVSVYCVCVCVSLSFQLSNFPLSLSLLSLSLAFLLLFLLPPLPAS